MALKIVWTNQALKGFQEVLNYLEEEWTAKEVLQLEKNIDGFIERISRYPNIYPASKTKQKLRKGLVDKNNYIVFRLFTNPRRIVIINFRGTRQNTP